MVAAPGDDAVCVIELASGDQSCVSFGPTFNPEVGLVISVPGELVTLLGDEAKVLAVADVERGAFPTAIQTTTDLSTVAIRNREREAVGGLPAAPDTVELVETQTGRVVEVPDAPVHAAFDPTSRWVATVYPDESTDPVTWVVAVAPIASPSERVEVFRSNADEYFLRTDRDARRAPASSPPAPLAVWSTDQHLVVSLTQSGVFLDLDLTGWSPG